MTVNDQYICDKFRKKWQRVEQKIFQSKTEIKQICMCLLFNCESLLKVKWSGAIQVISAIRFTAMVLEIIISNI